MSIEYNQKYMKHFYDPVWENFEDGFWQGIRQRRLKFQKCSGCGTFSHPPRVRCAKCKGDAWEWVESSGQGRIYSWTVARQEVHPAYRVPFEVVLVEMVNEPGVRMISNMIDCTPEEIAFGMPVEVCFRDVAKGWALPMFRKAGN